MPILEDGQIFERYRIIKWLGTGSSGESYEAEDKLLLRKVTLKLIHPWTTLPDSARRQFFREMQGISTLNHHYLAPVLDYGEIDGRIYVARRYVSSGSLLGSNGRFWFRPPLTVADAFIYVHQLAKVLHYIHQHGHTHGSLTFANVLVLRGPNMDREADYAPFLLADVGLAHFVRRFGKPSVETLPVSAAPEQKSQRLTPASDQFALAVLLYFWLAGHPPYLGTANEVERLKLSGTITPLHLLNPEVTTEQNGIILRALTAHPQERYASVLGFAEALTASLPSTPPSPIVPTHLSLQLPDTAHAFVSASPSSTKVHLSNIEIEISGPLTPIPDSLSEKVPVLDAFIATGAPQNVPVLDAFVATDAPQNVPVLDAFVATDAPQNVPVPDTFIATDAPQKVPVLDAFVATDAPPSALELLLGSRTQPELKPITGELTQVDPFVAETEPTETRREQSTPVDRNTTNAPTSTWAKSGENQEVSEAPLQADATAILPRLIISPPYSNNSYEFCLTNPETNIGRAGASDLVLDQDNQTSRHHALIKRVNERVLIFDKRSNNGVFVNGQQIEIEQGYELADGDHISIGGYELIFRYAPSSLP
jgi:serine/threonine protein kinase/pSer/pThr/pTyr-binding forkhead associated (FHA) protein